MAVKKNKPEIRFKGFSDEWEERELGDFCMLGDIDHKMPQSVIDGIPYLMTGDFVGINELDFENSKRISTEDYEQLSKKIKPEAGDILFARYASVGAVRYVETQMKFLISYSCAIIKHNDIANGKYLFYYLQANEAQRKIELEINTGSQRNIGIDSLKKLIILLPQLREQDEVAAFFKHLDTLITLHQRKYDKLVTVKKAMLEKMFPQNGADVPEIRFKGFTKAWEVRELNIWADRYDNLRVPITATDRISGSTPYYGANGIQGYVEGCTHEGEFILVAEDGANDLKDYPVQYVNGKIWVNNHTHVLQAKKNIADNQFLKYAISQTNIEPFLVGGGRAKLNADTMMKIGITASANTQEQKRIGSYFAHLDNLITLHQRELEKLKNIKKACLEKMFV